MKRFNAFAAIGVFLLLSPANLWADCPDINTHSCCGGFTWKSYTFDLSCAVVSADVGTTTFEGLPMHSVSGAASTQTIDYTYTIGQTSSGWEIRVDYVFNNGGDTSNFIKVTYIVKRGTSTIDSGTILDRNTSTAGGAVASVSGRSWNAGDVLTVNFSLRATGDSYGFGTMALFKVPA